MNELQLFNNKRLNLKVRAILNLDGSISINIEDTAIGFGWTTVAKSGNVVIRWARINEYCQELGFTDKVGKDDYIPESLFYMLGMKANNETALKFQKWLAIEVLPSIRKTGTYSTNQQLNIPFPDIVKSVQIVANDLKVNDASKILMYDTLYKDYNLPTSFLPQYELNGSKELKSATELLKKFDLKLSTIAFNNLMIENGYLEEKTRNSAKETSKIKKYKALTEKGLKYGENAVSAQNQREVQPLYYTDTFKELFDVISGKVGAVL